MVNYCYVLAIVEFAYYLDLGFWCLVGLCFGYLLGGLGGCFLA